MRVVIFYVITFGVCGAILGVANCWTVPTLAAAEPQQKKSLPPLIVDTDALLLPEGPATKVGGEREVSPSVVENTACYVCHANYSEEPLVKWHASEGIGCVDCHGKSFAHRNDENNTTPPEVMFPIGQIDESCEGCHDSHDVSAASVVERLQQRVPRVRSGEPIVCTQCHGQHRLGHRTVVWDRSTRKLLTGSQDSSQQRPAPTLETLKSLAGTWVQIDPQGQASDKVISTYRVTAAGSAVVEVLFPGDEHEMLTVYHQDGRQLLLTHYCAAKNQPRMKCVAGDDPRTLVFDFVDASNMRSPNDHHMHGVTLTVLSPDHIQSVWQSYENGSPVGVVRFDLARKR